MSISNSNLIACMEIESVLKKDKTFEDNLLAVMKEAKHHWLGGDEASKFNNSLYAIGKFYGIESPEYARLEKASKQLRAVQSIQSGIMPDLAMLEASLPSDEEVPPIALKSFWDKCDAPPEAKGGFVT